MAADLALKVALNIGCGMKQAEFEGYDKTVNLDLRTEVKPDAVAEAHRLPFEDGTIGLAHLSHLLEHFTRKDGRKLLLSIWDKLIKPKGKLWIVVPNIEWACLRVLRQGDIDPTSMDVFWGHQEYGTNFHKTGFTRKSLREFVGGLGKFNVLSCETRADGFEIELKAETIAG